MTFEGFPKPTKNFFSMPNAITDIIAEITNMAELKVIIYVIRHTWGFHEYGKPKAISVDEFMHGRRLANGSRMDNGTGLSHHSVIEGCKRAVDHGYLLCEVDDSDMARVKKSYALKMIDASEEPAPGEEFAPPEEFAPGAESSKSSAESASSSAESSEPMEDSAPRSEKDTSERHSGKTPEKNTSPARATSSPSEQKPTIPDLRGGLREYNQEIRQETAAQIKKREEMRKAEIFALYARLTGVSKVVKSKENQAGADMLVDIDASDEDITIAVEEIQDDPFWSKQMNLRTVGSQLQNRVSERKKRGGKRSTEAPPSTPARTVKNQRQDTGLVEWHDDQGNWRMMTYAEADSYGWNGGFGDYIQHTDYGSCPDTRPAAQARQAQEMRGAMYG